MIRGEMHPGTQRECAVVELKELKVAKTYKLTSEERIFPKRSFMKCEYEPIRNQR